VAPIIWTQWREGLVSSDARDRLLPEMSRLTGKAAIVTGGGGGIGGATARALAREGAAVLVVDIEETAAEGVAAGIRQAGGLATSFKADLSVEDQVEAAVDAATSQFGRLDVLHNNAALTDSDFLKADTAVTDLSLEVWDRTLAVNLRSQMLACKHAVPVMVRGGGGSIINMSSGASLKGDRTRTAYGVSKAGVNALTLYVATSHGKQGIRVNTILRGLVITDAVRAHLDEATLARLGGATLTPYVGQPEDIADVVVFLASDESRYVTGQSIAVDGGMSAHVGFGGGG
jgi:NAD(P)-dependent dehydrogenase (short-subunit alcohol dehydrogenase family)